MADRMLARRTFLAGTAAAATLPLLPRHAHAAGKLVAATFPGDTEDMIRKTITPILAAKGIELIVAPILAQDQVGKMMASAGKPPFDALYVSPGQTAVLIANNLIQKVDPSKMANWSKLDPAFQTEWGPTVHVQVDGIAYNPTKVPKPKDYRDLFTNPAFDKQISLIGFGSNSATAAWVEIAKSFGGSAKNMEPMFEMLQKYLPKVGAIANSGSQQLSLFQQGEVNVFLGSTGNVARLKGLGVPCAFAKPETGALALPVRIHLTTGSADPDAVYAYMDASISAEVQNIFKGPPLAYFPTNKDVALPPDVSDYVTRADLPTLVNPDWASINVGRAGWTERFNKIVAAR
jgi:putative spermidine/putrescine transport system substrate-binding protein